MTSEDTTKRSDSPTMTPAKREAMWGYLFIAAPLLGFLLFAAFPLVASVGLSFMNWDALTEPEWVGLENWQKVLSMTITDLPQEIDEETGEPRYMCGRERVPESQVPELEGTVEERTGKIITCEPRYVRATEVLPEGYKGIFEFNFLGRQLVWGARDPIMWEGIFNTIFLLVGIPISLALSLVLALALNQKIRGKHFYRVIYYLPTILPVAAVGLIWLWIFNPDYGLLNQILQSFGLPPTISSINWLQDRNFVKSAIIIIGVWGGLGYQMVIYLAGLQGIPNHLYEAAEIDGAGAWGKFRHVTWPMITPTTFFLLVTSLIGGFQVFTLPYIMTGGGPYHASTTMVMVIRDNAFRDLQMGYASSQAWLIGVVIMIITVINFSLARRWVFYETEQES
jgi:multiple sugar transport system permease protein